MNGRTLHAKVNGSNIFQTKSKMTEEHKRYLKHTASVGLLGCSITPERTRVQTLQKDDEHVLFFAESFSSSTGSQKTRLIVLNENGQNRLIHPCKIEIKICALTYELSTTLGGIIEEGDESNEDFNEHRINIDTNGRLNDFKISVEEAIQAFKGKTMISTKRTSMPGIQF